MRLPDTFATRAVIFLLPLGEGGAFQRRMRGLDVQMWRERTSRSGANPLIRPSGTFSQREKAMEPPVRWM